MITSEAKVMVDSQGKTGRFYWSEVVADEVTWMARNISALEDVVKHTLTEQFRRHIRTDTFLDGLEYVVQAGPIQQFHNQRDRTVEWELTAMIVLAHLRDANVGQYVSRDVVPPNCWDQETIEIDGRTLCKVGFGWQVI